MFDRSKAAILALMLLALVCPRGAVAAKDRPLGVVDTQRIAEEYEAARDAQEQYEKFLREIELEVNEKEKELTTLAEEIESQKMLLGEEALAAKMDQFEQKRSEYFQFREGIDKRMEQEYNQKIGPILDQIKTVVERLGKEQDFGLVIDSAALTVLYIDAEFDLTNDVLAGLARGDE